ASASSRVKWTTQEAVLRRRHSSSASCAGCPVKRPRISREGAVMSLKSWTQVQTRFDEPEMGQERALERESWAELWL
ncbi:unnamed protein product, partial [Mycena citricolor]